ncbi:MAG TPA: GAF domain-containing sensor histidine kinase [Puia sp.]|nr:GAF domain-containing sensor histidine kinase [Puia sp.]
MIKAPIPDDEIARLRLLQEYGILDTPEEEEFNEIVRLASKICHVPISLITLIDADRQWFKAKTGLDLAWTPRDISFCGHAMLNGEIFVVPDATQDKRFIGNPLVTGHPEIRFYAGVPLVSPQGGRLGTLCLIDREPHDLPAEQRDLLIVLARQVVRLMELRKNNRELKTVSSLETAQRKELERISEMQKRIIAILAHDIRSPLSSLKSLLQLIPESQGPLSAQGSLVEMAGGQLNATLGLLDNMVEWGQLELRGEGLEYREFVLHDTVRQLFFEQEASASLKGLALKNRVSEDLRLVSDDNRIRFILRNLLTNAIKFTKSGHITVDAVLTASSVIISVEDTGIGMPDSIMEQLFDGRKRIARKGTRNEPGSGLGLSLVKEFIEKMSGKIIAESLPGKGSSIAFTLPRFR